MIIETLGARYVEHPSWSDHEPPRLHDYGISGYVVLTFAECDVLAMPVHGFSRDPNDLVVDALQALLRPLVEQATGRPAEFWESEMRRANEL